MLELILNRGTDPAYRVLCLGAHSDDIEIGCGGTILELVDRVPNVILYWIVFGAQGQREAEAKASAELFLRGVADKRICVYGFRDSFFPFVGAEIKECFEQLKQEFDPDLIFTHYRNDLHQDHRVISDLTWNTFRNHLILEYEIPKYDGDLGTPNVFVHISEAVYRRKVQYLLEAFETQRRKQWFTEETFQALARLRGIESNAPERYAEAFYGRKLVWLP